MQFCNDCGSVLNLFEFPDEELCYSCRKDKDQKEVIDNPPPKPPEQQFSVDSLANAVLSYENNQIVLKSPEGWLLWSCPANGSSTMDKVVKRANRIWEIRQKRLKKNS